MKRSSIKPETHNGQPGELEVPPPPIHVSQSSSITSLFSAEPKRGLRIYLKRTPRRQYYHSIRVKSSYIFELAKASLITNIGSDTKCSLRKCLVNEGFTERLLKAWIILLHKMVRADIWDNLSEHTNSLTNHNKIINKTQRNPLLKASLSQKKKSWSEFCKQINSKFQMNRSCRSNQWQLSERRSRLQKQCFSLGRLPGHLRQGRKTRLRTIVKRVAMPTSPCIRSICSHKVICLLSSLYICKAKILGFCEATPRSPWLRSSATRRNSTIISGGWGLPTI